jgi:integrase
MRMKDYDTREGKRVWLSESEISLLLSKTDENRPEIDAALILASRCGLRRKEITGDDDRPGVRPSDLVSNDTGQVVRVWHGKGGKYREVPAPPELMQLALGMNREVDQELVTCDPSTIWDWVKRARERAHAETGDNGWLEVGPHDLRRSWGVRLLEAGVLPSVVMEWGGWDDWETFRDHYLAEFSPEALRRERGKVGWLAESGETNANQSYSAIARSADQFSGR